VKLIFIFLDNLKPLGGSFLLWYHTASCTK